MKKILIAIALLILFQINSSAGTDTLFEQGMSAFKSGNFGSSELLFKKIVDSSEDDFRDRAWFYLARSLYEQKKYKSAIYEFGSFLNKCRTPDLCLESRFWMAECYFFTEEHVKAIEEYKRYITQNKDGQLKSICYERIGQIYFNQKRYDEAVIEWETSISGSDDRERNLARTLKIGEALFRNREYDKSLNRLTPLTYSNDVKTASSARLIIGQIYQIQGNHNRAISFFNAIPDSLLKEHPFSEAQYLKAVSYIASGRPNVAKTYLEFFILLEKKSRLYYSAAYELGRIHLDMNDEKSAVKYLEDVRKNSGDGALRARASRQLSRLYISSNPEAAIPYLEEAVLTGDKEEKKEIMLMLARAYIETKKFSEAEDVLKAYADSNPFDKKIDEVNFLKARIYLERGENDRAIKMIEGIQIDNPFSKYVKESDYYLALANFKSGRYRETAANLKKYLANDKAENPFGAYNLLLETYMNLKDYKNAELAAATILKKFHAVKNIEALIYRYALWLRGAGKEKEARGYLSVIGSKYPETESAMNMNLMLADEYFEARDYKNAEAYYSKYMASGTGKHQGQPYHRYISVLYNLKKYDKLVLEVKKGPIPPMDETQLQDVLLFLSRSYFHLNRLEEVYGQMYNFNTREMSRDDLLMFIKSSLFVGDLDTAVRSSRYLESDRKLYSEYLYFMSRYYFNIKKYDDSSAILANIINDYTDSGHLDRARLLLSDIYIIQERYEDAIFAIKDIKAEDVSGERNIRLIISYFKTGDAKKAAELSDASLQAIQNSSYAVDIYRQNIEYYSSVNDLNGLNRYSALLSKTKTGEDFIVYHQSKMYYGRSVYDRAYSGFLRLSVMKSEYSAEAFYYLANLTLLLYQNKVKAMQYYQKAIEMDNNTPCSLKSKISLAVLLRELNRLPEAEKYLNEIISSPERGLYRSQALNLKELLK